MPKLLSIPKSFIKAHLLEISVLTAFSFLCLFLSLFRWHYTDSIRYLFLNWNLFLAFIPWALSRFLIARPDLHRKPLILMALLSVWLLFFPNAPYILTDLFHLRHLNGMPIWFDLLLIMTFAWTGLMFAFMSLWDIEKILLNKLSLIKTRMISVVLLFVGGFGVYLGRYLRWNSWDIIQEPFALLADVGDRLVNPFSHPTTWGMTLFMGLFLNMVYWSFRLIQHRDRVKE
jgi:uncharacterized membrane protein